MDSVDDMVIVELALQGTHTGPLAVPGGFLPTTGKRMNAPCCDVFRLVGGQIRTFNCYFEHNFVETSTRACRSAAPPARKGECRLLFHDDGAAEGWEELCTAAAGPMFDAWVHLPRDLRDRRSNPGRVNRLLGELGTRQVKGSRTGPAAAKRAAECAAVSRTCHG
jgi:hypothetical protein